MKVSQIATLMNSVTGEILGKSDVVLEDLSNIVDIGKQIFDTTDVDHYVKSLLNHIGKVIFVDRIYTGSVPSVMMDGWEYGSVLEKISCEIPDAEENDSWNLTDGETYNQDKFYQPKVSATFFNKKTTFEVPMSFTEIQVKESFSSAEQLNGFLSMLQNAVEKSITVKNDALIMRTINNMIGATVVADNAGTVKNVKAVNLAKLYLDVQGIDTYMGTGLITDPTFIRFAAFTMANYADRLSRLSSLFNINGAERFTPKDKLHTVLLSEFVNSANYYLQADTFHEVYTKLPNAETVPFWQGSGKDYAFNHTSLVEVKANTGTNQTSEVTLKGVLGVMFDRDALGVANMNKRITTHYNAKAEFYNNFYKVDAGYFNDFSENFVVFYADTENLS